MRLKIKVSPEYLPFYMLWPLLLVPQQFMQFLLVLLIFLLNFYKYRKIGINFDKSSKYFGAWIIVYVLSVLINSIDYKIDTVRILAECTKIITWFIGIYFFELYKNLTVNLEKIKKIMLFNIMIMVAFVILFNLYKPVNVTLFSRGLMAWDGIVSSTYNVRYAGFLEYATLNGQLILFLLPLLGLVDISRQKRIIIYFFLAYVLYISGSRIAIFTILICLLGYLVDLYGKKYPRMMIFVLLTVLVGILFNLKDIFVNFNEIFNSRADSNNTRFIVYHESIARMLEKNWLLGVGIRQHSSVGIYLGSHSTYISMLYRTGFMGFLLFIMGYVSLAYKRIMMSKYKFYTFMYLVGLAVYMLFEEIDPHHWCTMVLMVVSGLCVNENIYKER